MTRCFITGGTGFIGSHIVRTLIEREHEVSTLIRKSSNLDLIKGLEAKTVIGDVTDPESLDVGITEDIEWLFHNAAIMKDWGGKDHFNPINVEGTRNILEIVRKKDIPQLIYTSSTAVYGFPNESEPMNEDHSWAPMSPYQDSKAEAESLLREYVGDYGIKVSIVRPPMVLGHGDMFTGPQFIDYLKNGKMVLIGGGKNIQSIAHGHDVARLLVLTAEKFHKAAGNAYNSVSFTIEMRLLFEALAEELGVSKKFRNIPYKLAVGMGKMMGSLYGVFGRKNAPLITDFRAKMLGSNYYIDSTKAERELGFIPKWDLQSTVLDMVTWGGSVKSR